MESRRSFGSFFCFQFFVGDGEIWESSDRFHFSIAIAFIAFRKYQQESVGYFVRIYGLVT